MSLADPSEPYPVFLAIDCPSGDVNRATIVLSDLGGRRGTGVMVFRPERSFAEGNSTSNGNRTWGQFLEDYSTGGTSNQGVGVDQLAAFGRSLFQILLRGDEETDGTSEMAMAFGAIRGVAGKRPLDLTLRLGPMTERFAALPWEALHDEVGYVFARPGASVRRVYRLTSEKPMNLPAEPRVLMAWACPEGSGGWFDANPHVAVLKDLFGDRHDVLADATLSAIVRRLDDARAQGEPFHVLHIMAHGYRDPSTAGICLADADGHLDTVYADRLAMALAARGLELVFLCSCRTADAGSAAFSGVGQQLLSHHGADVPCVVATQANLKVHGSAELADAFYRRLLEGVDPALALSRARRAAFQAGHDWTVPVLLARPAPIEAMPRQDRGAPSPIKERRATYEPRPKLEEQILEALTKHRLVSVVGLPGIGKTELGQECARKALETGLVDEIVYVEAAPGTTVDQIRALTATSLGSSNVPETDRELAYLFESRGRKILWLIDNAEDLMRTDAEQDVFAAQLDEIVGFSSQTTILLTTRWLAGTEDAEHAVEIPPMHEEEVRRLLESELRAAGAMREEWLGTEAWDGLVGVIDGHPRTLRLLSRQIHPRVDLRQFLDRVLDLKQDAILDPRLVGKDDVYEALAADKKARLKSLVASMNLSFETLRARHPKAVEAFVALSLFPSGLPESVARDVVGDLELDQLYRYHLVQWHGDRTFYPVPLHWYAETQRASFPIDEDSRRIAAIESFGTFAEGCDRQLIEGEIVSGVSRILAEIPGVEALIRWAVDSENLPNAPVGRLWALAQALLLANQYEICRGVLEAGAESAKRRSESGSLGRCLHYLGDLQIQQSQLADAEDSYTQALDIFRAIGARLGEANCLQSLGDLQNRQDQLAEAKDAYTQALDIFRAIGDRLGEANCLRRLGDLQIRQSQLADAEDSYTQALDIFRAIGASLGEANCLQSLGDLQRRQDQLADAEDSYTQALDIFRAIDDRLGEANCLQRLGQLDQKCGRLPAAFDRFRELLDVFSDLEEALGVQAVLGYLAQTLAAGGGFERAILLAEMSLDLGRKIDDRFGQTITLSTQIGVWLQTKEIASALGAMLVYRDTARAIGDPAADLYEPILRSLDKLPDETREALLENPEAVRIEGVRKAAEALKEAGIDPLDPPDWDALAAAREDEAGDD